jgi:hypothetical protein
MVFLPTSSPSPNFWGGKRPGNNEHANSVVALRAEADEIVWSFQTVHHDVWDYDVPAQPTVTQVDTGNGEMSLSSRPSRASFSPLTGKRVDPSGRGLPTMSGWSRVSRLIERKLRRGSNSDPNSELRSLPRATFLYRRSVTHAMSPWGALVAVNRDDRRPGFIWRRACYGNRSCQRCHRHWWWPGVHGSNSCLSARLRTAAAMLSSGREGYRCLV